MFLSRFICCTVSNLLTSWSPPSNSASSLPAFHSVAYVLNSWMAARPSGSMGDQRLRPPSPPLDTYAIWCPSPVRTASKRTVSSPPAWRTFARV